MDNFGLVVIGAHSGVWLTLLFEEYQNQNILLVEPVPYNIALLKENTTKYKNINIETSAVSEKNEIKKFYYVKPDAVKKLLQSSILCKTINLASLLFTLNILKLKILNG